MCVREREHRPLEINDVIKQDRKKNEAREIPEKDQWMEGKRGKRRGRK